MSELVLLGSPAEAVEVSSPPSPPEVPVAPVPPLPPSRVDVASPVAVVDAV